VVALGAVVAAGGAGDDGGEQLGGEFFEGLGQLGGQLVGGEVGDGAEPGDGALPREAPGEAALLALAALAVGPEAQELARFRRVADGLGGKPRGPPQVPDPVVIGAQRLTVAHEFFRTHDKGGRGVSGVRGPIGADRL
jgi:hypothetical protein